MEVQARYQCVVFRCEQCGLYVYSIHGNKTINCPHCNTRTGIDYDQAQVFDSLLEAARLTQQYNKSIQDDFVPYKEKSAEVTSATDTKPSLPQELISVFEQLDKLPSSHKHPRLRLILLYLITVRDVFVIPQLATLFEEGWLEGEIKKLEEDGLIHIDEVHNTIRFTGDIDELYPRSGSITKCRKAIKQLFFQQKTIKITELYQQLEALGYTTSIIERAIYLLRYSSNNLVESTPSRLTWTE